MALRDNFQLGDIMRDNRDAQITVGEWLSATNHLFQHEIAGQSWLSFKRRIG
jgi:hypothetical protein